MKYFFPSTVYSMRFQSSITNLNGDFPKDVESTRNEISSAPSENFKRKRESFKINIKLFHAHVPTSKILRERMKCYIVIFIISAFRLNIFQYGLIQRILQSWRKSKNSDGLPKMNVSQ